MGDGQVLNSAFRREVFMDCPQAQHRDKTPTTAGKDKRECVD
jgi:hypothetical protein